MQTVNKSLWTKEFKNFLKVYDMINGIKSVLSQRLTRQQSAAGQTQEMLAALEERRAKILSIAPRPVDDLPEQEQMQ